MTMNSIGNCLAEADAVLIGAGSGLSTAAGLKYDGPDFERFFAPFIKRYGFTDLYTSSFYEFDTEEERWAYWAAHVMYSRLLPPALPLYTAIRAMVQEKPHFVITTNVDGQFRKAGFDANNLFEVQGDYAFIQRRSGSDGQVTDATELFRKMYAQTADCRVPTALVPVAPDGEPMEMHLRVDENFVEDEAWHRQADAYYGFIRQYAGGNLLLLELGVGFNTPTIIRHPFEQMAQQLPHATLVRLNRDFPQAQLALPRFYGLRTLDMETLRMLQGQEG